MCKTFKLFLIFFLATHVSLSQVKVDTVQQLIQPLFGSWQIDLRPSPKDNPYLQEFVVSSFESGKLSGFFYNSPFTDGRVNLAWGKVYFAFTTGDKSGT